MTPQERDLLTQLGDRLRRAAPQQKDPEAQALVHEIVAAQPDSPYLLAQTVLIQDFALSQAQAKIAELERQLAAAKAAQAGSGGGFLSHLFGRGSDAPPARAPQAAQPNPWGQFNSARPGMAQRAGAPPQPGYAQPGYGSAVGAPQAGAFGAGSPWGGGQQGSSFLRSAATTALGVAGGAMLFEGIQSMFHHGGGFGGGSFMQPGPSLSESAGFAAPTFGGDGGDAGPGGYNDAGYGGDDTGDLASGGGDTGGSGPSDPGYDPQSGSSGGDSGGGWDTGSWDSGSSDSGSGSDWSSDSSFGSGGGDDWV